MGWPLGPFTAPSQSPVPAYVSQFLMGSSCPTPSAAGIHPTCGVHAGVEAEIGREARDVRAACALRGRGVHGGLLGEEGRRCCGTALAGAVEVLQRDEGGGDARALCGFGAIRGERDGDGRIVDGMSGGDVGVQRLISGTSEGGTV